MKINQKFFKQLIDEAIVIHYGCRGQPKLYQLANGNYLKLYYLKRVMSTALLYHYADRFAFNAYQLKRYEIATVNVVNTYELPAKQLINQWKVKAVEYKRLEGQLLRELIIGLESDCTSSTQEEILTGELARFVAKLHNLGIYFKAIHFANLIYQPKLHDKFGLIDIDNLKFFNEPLTNKHRKRNFNQLMAYTSDKGWLLKNFSIFKKYYNENCVCCTNHIELFE